MWCGQYFFEWSLVELIGQTGIYKSGHSFTHIKAFMGVCGSKQERKERVCGSKQERKESVEERLIFLAVKGCYYFQL